MRNRRPLYTIASAFLLTSLLSGCAVQNSIDSPDGVQAPPATDPSQARTDLHSQLDEVQELVGGEWTNSDETGPIECALDGGSGVTFTGFRLTNDSAGETGLEEISALSEEMGFEITTQNDVGPYKRVIATSPTDPGNVLIFGVAENAMSLWGQGTCAEGDLLEWIHKTRDELEESREE